MFKRIKGKWEQIKGKWERFSQKHPRLTKRAEEFVDDAVPSIMTAGTMLVGFLALAVAVKGCSNMVRDHEFRPDDRKGTLVAKEKHGKDVNLYMDLDGNTNTIEALVRCNTSCDREAINLKFVKEGTTKTVQEWKKFLKDDCFEKHYSWREITR